MQLNRYPVCLLIVISVVISQVLAQDAAKPRAANRLAKETSPYLLLHAHNPVDWYPWGEEALAKAKAENKIIFLSIGYSSCYWCHVMERETFMDDEIARTLNQNFVCIKVDREERPDLDEIYMQALQVYLRLAGSQAGGGWPLSMFLTPDAKPLVGGTYFPPRDREGHAGFPTVLARVMEVWKADPARLQQTGNSLAELVAETLAQQPLIAPIKLETALVEGVQAALFRQYDKLYGGFGFDPATPARPKFPEPPNLAFLAEQMRSIRSETAKVMLLTTLDKIVEGGIHDHVGGGFHRYSTDRFWRVPHFEKMLYDNAQLTSNYAKAYELTQRPAYRRIVLETLDFVSRELTDPAGGFYAAIDAETDGHEGEYYVWKKEEVAAALTAQEMEIVGAIYGLGGESNFEERYIPLLSKPLSEEAKSRQLTEDQLEDRLRPIRQKLLALRAQRKRPLVDTKIVTAWNGLMIRGLADSARILKHQPAQAAAVKAADFVLANLRDPRGRLLRSYAAGQAKLPAYLDDYALLVDGLIALHQATGETRWLDIAGDLTDKQLDLFWDDRVGGFFYTARDHEALIARSKLPIDNVTPGGNSQAAINMLYLAGPLSRPDYVGKAEKCIQSASVVLQDNPASVPMAGLALSRLLETRTAPAAK